MVPYGAGDVCSANAKSGFGKRLKRPSSTIACAPETNSSDGWPTNSSVPCQRSLRATSAFAVPTQLAMCTSWPQLCATNVSRPFSVVIVRLAYGNPVFSSIGNPSSSVRTSTVGPAPLR